MFVQWCVKGIRGVGPSDPPASGLTEKDAKDVIDRDYGILCNWWRNVGKISPAEIAQKLTPVNLNRHVHDYPRFEHETPFISLSAGCVERDVALRLNRIYEAADVALRFATGFGQRPGYLFHCWVIVGNGPAVGVPGVAERIRDLNTYTSYSDYQLEGEITAKIHIPAGHIERCERWDCDGTGKVHSAATWTHRNRRFESPAQLSNILDAL